ncbi:MAG: archaemetzincin family Zn-dependent metalloprotease [Planctomycetota bacterium]|nr:archaemetzincin family Zn-dependent metalloprotease [Planctomycetota bacterium]MDI6787755.1 archaemetzincin family Zn-dependent metalloprotease [Planctomycetota bacterium]
MDYIYLTALGGLQEGVLDLVQNIITTRINLPPCSEHSEPIKTLSPLPSPDYAYLEKRNQYDASKILEQISHSLPQDGIKIIALTELDLGTLVLSYVFGLAELEGKAVVVSTCRLRQEFYRLPRNDALLLERLSKEILHELGHSFGLVHCLQPYCVMSRSTTINQIDTKMQDFCPRCRELLNAKLVDK